MEYRYNEKYIMKIQGNMTKYEITVSERHAVDRRCTWRTADHRIAAAFTFLQPNPSLAAFRLLARRDYENESPFTCTEEKLKTTKIITGLLDW